MGFYYLDGQILSTNVGISPFDLSIHRSFAVFDYCLFKNNTPLYFGDYLSRFRSSIRSMGLELNKSDTEIRKVVQALIKKNQVTEGGIKLLYSGGHSSNAYKLEEPSLMIFILDIPVYPKAFYSQGLKLVSLEYQRQFPLVKTTNYFTSLANEQLLVKGNAQDFIYYNDGIISESSRSNLFFIKEGILKTAKQHVLEGITRKHTLRVCQNKIPIEVGDFRIEELLDADEVFITSSTKKIMPVSAIDHVKFLYNEDSLVFKILEWWNTAEKQYYSQEIP
jgi:branched-chain amino acid aminotransferase